MQRAIMRFWIVALGALLASLPACDSPPSADQGGLHSPNPASKLYAIHRAGEMKDRAAVPDIVERLHDDDPAVRLFAIKALEQITGERYGYNPYASADARQSAINRWEDAVRKGRFSTAE